MIDLSKLQDFDAIFCQGNKIVSKAIQTGNKLQGSKSKTSHVGDIRIINGQVFVVDAQKEGYQPRKLEDWIKEFGYRVKVMRERNLTPEKIARMKELQYTYLGKEYDFVGAFKVGRSIVRDFLNKFRKNDKPPYPKMSTKDENKRFFCSEAFATIREWDETQITPWQAEMECQHQLWETIVEWTQL